MEAEMAVLPLLVQMKWRIPLESLWFKGKTALSHFSKEGH